MPPRTEAQRIQQLLPDLGDGGRWTAENEGYGWKVRRLYDGKRPSQRYFSLRWATWDQMKETHDTDTIRRILSDKVADKCRRLAAAA